VNTYKLDGYFITADSEAEALDTLYEYVNSGEPLDGIEPAHTGYTGHFTGAWICNTCGPLCIQGED
jgi:hypothetical protein